MHVLGWCLGANWGSENRIHTPSKTGLNYLEWNHTPSRRLKVSKSAKKVQKDIFSGAQSDVFQPFATENYLVTSLKMQTG